MSVDPDHLVSKTSTIPFKLNGLRQFMVDVDKNLSTGDCELSQLMIMLMSQKTNPDMSTYNIALLMTMGDRCDHILDRRRERSIVTTSLSQCTIDRFKSMDGLDKRDLRMARRVVDQFPEVQMKDAVRMSARLKFPRVTAVYDNITGWWRKR